MYGSFVVTVSYNYVSFLVTDSFLLSRKTLRLLAFPSVGEWLKAQRSVSYLCVCLCVGVRVCGGGGGGVCVWFVHVCACMHVCVCMRVCVCMHVRVCGGK